MYEAINARSLYISNLPASTATWYGVDPGSSDAAATFTTELGTLPTDSILPPKYTDQGSTWNVDHVVELQIIVAMFSLPRPTVSATSITADAWVVASSAANTAGTACNAIASAITTTNNLRGIPASLNSFQGKAFSCFMLNTNCPTSGTGASFFNYFGPALRQDLLVNQATSQSVVIPAIANTLQTIAIMSQV